MNNERKACPVETSAAGRSSCSTMQRQNSQHRKVPWREHARAIYLILATSSARLKFPFFGDTCGIMRIPRDATIQKKNKQGWTRSFRGEAHEIWNILYSLGIIWIHLASTCIYCDTSTLNISSDPMCTLLPEASLAQPQLPRVFHLGAVGVRMNAVATCTQIHPLVTTIFLLCLLGTWNFGRFLAQRLLSVHLLIASDTLLTASDTLTAPCHHNTKHKTRH